MNYIIKHSVFMSQGQRKLSRLYIKDALSITDAIKKAEIWIIEVFRENPDLHVMGEPINYIHSVKLESSGIIL